MLPCHGGEAFKTMKRLLRGQLNPGQCWFMAHLNDMINSVVCAHLNVCMHIHTPMQRLNLHLLLCLPRPFNPIRKLHMNIGCWRCKPPCRKLTPVTLTPFACQQGPPSVTSPKHDVSQRLIPVEEMVWPNLAGLFNYSPALAFGPRLFNSFAVALSIPHHLLYSWIKNMEEGSMWSTCSYQNSVHEL